MSFHEVSQKEVAARARVSPKTVSNVLTNRGRVSEAARKRVMEAVKELKYSPLRARRTPQYPIIGVCIPDPEAAHYSELTNHIIGYAWARNWVVVPQATNDNEADELRAVEMFKRLGVVGVILTSSRIGEAAARALEAEGILMVSIVSMLPGQDRPAPHLSECPLPLDHFQGTLKATNRLIELGHQRIGYLAGPPNSSSNQAKREGYKEALLRANLQTDEPDRYIVELERQRYDYRTGLDGCKELIGYQPSPTAIVCYNDELALGALACLRDKAVDVPAQVSIVGNDDIKIAEFLNPPLATVRVPRQELARIAVQMIHEHLDKQDIREQPPIVPKWVPRGSIGPPPPQH